MSSIALCYIKWIIYMWCVLLCLINKIIAVTLTRHLCFNSSTIWIMFYSFSIQIANKSILTGTILYKYRHVISLLWILSYNYRYLPKKSLTLLHLKLKFIATSKQKRYVCKLFSIQVSKTCEICCDFLVNQNNGLNQYYIILKQSCWHFYLKNLM